MKLSKLNANMEMITKSAGCFTIIGVVLVTFLSSNLMFKLAQYLAINAAYGHEAWQHGLHITGKGGQLSNGDTLSGWSYLIVYPGTFLLTIPFFFGSYLLFGYIGMRIRGRRPSDPPPKKKWDSSHKLPRTAHRD
jgi:hypothetical protein